MRLRRSTPDGPESPTQQSRVPIHRSRARSITALAVASAFAISACGGGNDNSSSSGDSGGSAAKAAAPAKMSVNYAVTSPIVPPQLPPYTAPLISGKDFGLEMSKSNLQVLNSTPTALQLLLSGKIDATSGAFLGYLAAREKQPQLRAFCPEQTTTNAVVVSTNPKVTSLADLTKGDARVLVESPGGPNDFFMNEALKAAGVDLKVGDLKNTRIVENMEQRFSALASGNADVGVVWNYNVADLGKARGADKVKVLADFTKYPSVYLAYISTEKWLGDHADEAAAFCASVLKTNRDLAASYEVFKQQVDAYVEGSPPEQQVRMTWEAANGSEMWPSKSGLAKTDVDPLLEMALASGAIKKPMTYEDVVDPRPFEKALELLNK